jgi:predicted neutral ceramidase superfamily lipid hydrolase
MPYFFAILSTLAGSFLSLMMLVLLMAGGANSTPSQISQIKAWLIAVSLVALGCLVASVWTMVVKRPWIAAGIGGFPILLVIVSFAAMWRMGR